MPDATPIVRRLVLAWAGIWLFVAVTGLLGGFGFQLLDLLMLDFQSLFDGAWYRIVGVLGYAFIHEPFPGLLHVFFNCYFLWIFGSEVETLYSGQRFVRFVLYSILVGAGAHLLLHLLVGGVFSAPVLGGSGVVMAVVAVNAAVYPGRILNLIFFRLRMMTFFLVYCGIDLLRFLYSLQGGITGSVASDVHLSGALFGWMWAAGFQRFDTPLGRWGDKMRAKREHRRRESERDDEAELDRILAKINREGIGSLSRKERAFLDRRSKKG